MLKIYICEDDNKQLEIEKNIVEKIILMESYDAELALTTSDPYEVLAAIEKDNNSGIYFLDVDLKSDINGLKLAEKIRKFDPRGFIIFITNHAEMSYLTFIYKVEALDYILKDNHDELPIKIKKCIENCIEKYSNSKSDTHKIYSIKLDEKIINIEYSKILFFETSPNIHKVILNCIDRQMEFYGSLKEIEASLDERFARCHMSFIVNKENIKFIDKKNKKAIMKNGQECYISTRGMKQII